MGETELQFTPSRAGGARCAVVAVTPAEQAFMHTYYDVRPQSPSGRLLACLRLPFEDRQPTPDDAAEVCVIDLRERTVRIVAQTRAWGFQTAAHQGWGRTDRFLHFNDRRDGRCVGVRLDLETGPESAHRLKTCATFEGPVWQVHPGETFAIGTCLVRANLTQPGYGAAVWPGEQPCNASPAADDDGLYRVDLQTGRQALLVSLRQAWEALSDRQDLQGASLYAFHCKFNPQGTRILLVVRARFDDGQFLSNLLICRPDGSGLKVLVGHRLWRRGGHHPIWHPDGERVLMNLTPGQDGMRFCLADARTGAVTVLIHDPPGGGHPSISPDGRFLLTDDTREAEGTRSATIRLVDLSGRSWRDLCTVASPAVGGSPLRRDAHPVWDSTGRRIWFLAAPAGKRQLFIADPDLNCGDVPQF